MNWSKPLDIPQYVFNGIDKTTCFLYVPKGTIKLYQGSAIWTDFKYIKEFGNDDNETFYLTIKQGDGGLLKLVVEYGKQYQFVIKHEYYWEIHSATYNGEDITWMIEDGNFTTPIITGNAELSVIYHQIGNSVKAATASNIKVQASAGTVTISGADLNAPVSIYTTSGMLVKSAKGNATLSLDSDGVYIIKVGEETFKVRM